MLINSRLMNLTGVFLQSYVYVYVSVSMCIYVMKTLLNFYYRRCFLDHSLPSSFSPSRRFSIFFSISLSVAFLLFDFLVHFHSAVQVILVSPFGPCLQCVNVIYNKSLFMCMSPLNIYVLDESFHMHQFYIYICF